ncbi:MAG: shikimate dehydrogenase [Bacteroidales bacterium]|nr:shikimate dehydrogenase [Bacteroidales bacterium]
MKRFALIGHPLGHSFSQAYFTEKFQREKIDACYEVFDLENISEIRQILLKYTDLQGFNVTIPYKEAIIPYLDDIDKTAEEVGAVNTVKVLEDGKLKGFNTDIIGLEASLCVIAKEARHPALILGTGGASKAVQYVLKQQGLPFHLVSRDPNKGHFTYEALTPEIIKEHLLIINATPVGMAPKITEAPVIPYEALTSQHILFDLIYNPEETLFLKRGKEHGAQTINGLTMLHAQAEASWEVWNQE